MNNTNTLKSFKTIMDSYRELSDTMKWAIRTCASQKLIEEGAEEVGSSDVNHAIVALYKECGSFGNIIIKALDGDVQENGSWSLIL